MALKGVFELEVERKVRSFLTSNFYFSKDEFLKGDMSLLDIGIIDSTGVLELVAFIEDEFVMSVDDAEMTPENLDSIDGILSYVLRKTRGTSEPASNGVGWPGPG